MTIWRVISTKGQGNHLTFDPGLLKYDNFIHLDPQKPLGQILCSLIGLKEQMFAQTVGVTWQAWPSCPIMVKTLLSGLPVRM